MFWVDDSSGAVRVLYLKIGYEYIQINILKIIKVMSALPQIKERLKELGLEKDEVEEMDLSEIKIDQFTADVKKHLEEYKSVKVLILQDCGLASLSNLPDWDLYVIDLTQNKISDAELGKLVSFKNLNQLICTSNEIKKLQPLKGLSALQTLAEVDFSENPIAGAENYRSWLYENIPSLEIIDNVDKEGNPVEEQQEFDQDEEDDQDDSQFDDGDEEEEDDYDEESSVEKPKKKKK